MGSLESQEITGLKYDHHRISSTTRLCREMPTLWSSSQSANPGNGDDDFNFCREQYLNEGEWQGNLPELQKANIEEGIRSTNLSFALSMLS